MPGKYGGALPQLSSPRMFLTEGGLETTLIFKKGFDLPQFAAFTLLDTEEGRLAIWDCYVPYIQLAKESKTGIVIETPTWRANAAWIRKMDLPETKIAEANSAAVDLFKKLRAAYETEDTPIVISGVLGPLGDAYAYANPQAGDTGTAPEAASSLEAVKTNYRGQVEALASAGADMIGIMTVTSTDEAVAAVLLAKENGLPVWVSFTVETNGRLEDGRTAAQFVSDVDAATGGYAAYFGINCAHPTHFLSALRELPEETRRRIMEVRANASEKSHAELDESDTLDRGDPKALGAYHGEIRDLLPELCVVGGCCGTDEEHVCEMARTLLN